MIGVMGTIISYFYKYRSWEIHAYYVQCWEII